MCTNFKLCHRQLQKKKQQRESKFWTMTTGFAWLSVYRIIWNLTFCWLTSHRMTVAGQWSTVTHRRASAVMQVFLHWLIHIFKNVYGETQCNEIFTSFQTFFFLPDLHNVVYTIWISFSQAGCTDFSLCQIHDTIRVPLIDASHPWRWTNRKENRAAFEGGMWNLGTSNWTLKRNKQDGTAGS